MSLEREPADDPGADFSWLSADIDLLAKGEDWWLVACMDWPRDRWIGYIQGYWKAATVLAEQVAVTGRDQDYLVYPFLMCWRHYVELQLKALILLARAYRREPANLPLTHKIDQLWRVARPLLRDAFPGDSQKDLDNAERVLLQLNSFDPTSEHFRYPIQRDGSETLSALGRVHIRRFHDAMEAVACLLDGSDTGIRAMTDQRNEYEEAMRDLYGG
ncbi:hypothetical protein ACFY2Q_25655 [Micromonospora sp. NPDC000316]|uniref:hypothetical protein n=1 Tax=Micromonospora sp. NPDC000316 TaxID=3364216 RepID=UPI0036A98013